MSRRGFLRILAAGAAGALVFKGGWDVLSPGPQVVTESALIMGTVVDLTVAADDPVAARSAARACLDRMSTLEAMLSRFQPRSELSRLNAEGRLANASEPLRTLLAHSRALSERSGGAFDISVMPLITLYEECAAHGSLPPARAIREARSLVDYRAVECDGPTVVLKRAGMQLSLDGIAKGFIVDAGTAELRAHGMTDVLVEAGGDLMARGEKEPGRPWQVGIESPRREHAGFMTTCELTDRAMATSGDYMQPYTADLREYHILDPRLGRSPRELASATATAPTVMLADALATTLMVVGERGGKRLLERMSGCEGYMVTKDLDVVTSSGFGC